MEFRGMTQMAIFVFVTLCFLIVHLSADTDDVNVNMIVEDQVHVGVILDVGSIEGKIILSCVEMALADFYHLHYNYSTRVTLHSKDSKGKPLTAMSAALDLLDNIKVEAIIGAQTKTEANLLADLGEATQLLVMSLSPPFTGNKYTFLVEIMCADQATEVKGVSAIVETFRWKNVILLYDNTEYERVFIPSLDNSIRDIEHGSVNFRSSNIASSSTNEEIIEELQKLMKLDSNVFVVQVSHLLVPRLFLCANKLGMMSEGYTWIVTSTSMNFLDSMDVSVIESMLGVLGFRFSTPASLRIHSLTTRLRRKFKLDDPDLEAISELSAEGIWAYDATWALAEAIERARPKNCTTRSTKGFVLLREIMQSRSDGLTGRIHYQNGKLISSDPFEIVNVRGKGEIKRIGLWPCKDDHETRNWSNGSTLSTTSRKCLVSTLDIRKILWPGGSKRELDEPRKLKIGVPVRRGFTELVHIKQDDKINKSCVTGFSIDVFKAAIAGLPYEVEYELIPFRYANGEPGSSDDLVQQVYLKNFDAAVGDITITWNRSQYVDFTIPYTDFGVGVLVPNMKSMWIFFRPLSLNLWMASAAFFILTGSVVWLIERPTNEEFQGTAGEQVGTVLFFSFSTLVFALGLKLSSNLAKFVVIIWVFIVLILTSTYTATLASMMTVNQIQMNSKGNHIGYQLGSLNVTVNLNFTGTRPLKSVAEYKDALTKGSKHGGVSAIIDEIPYINIFLGRYPHGYSMITTNSTTNGFAFGFPQGSKLARDLSKQIECLRQDGRLFEMEKTWFHRKLDEEDHSKSDVDAIGFKQLRGLFLISGVSLIIAVLLSKTFKTLVRDLLQLIRRQLQKLRIFVL